MEDLYYYKDYYYGIIRNYVFPIWYKGDDISKITENIYLSDYSSSLNKDKLLELGITDIICVILNVAPVYPDNFNYFNISIRDVETENIMDYFEDTYNYIKNVEEKNGKVLVHCSYGVSRSATIVMSYLMRKYKMGYEECYKFVKSKRDKIEPNEGFKNQLILYSKNFKCF